MKLFYTTCIRLILLFTVIFAPATLVEGKKKISDRTFITAAAVRTSAIGYHSADAIKKILSYTLSAAPVYKKNTELSNLLRAIALKAEWKRTINIAAGLYDKMELEGTGLSKKAFEYAWMGYYKLRKKGCLHNTDVLSICDFSQSSSQERMYVIDVANRKLLYRTFVAHGINSGQEYASSFSNRPESYKSSMGFYVTRQTYYGRNGLSLRIQGMDKGFNDLAGKRNIVIHGAPYVSRRILNKYGVMGTTFGCPAIPEEMSRKIIPAVEHGSCFFIFYPSKKYFSGSTVLNG
ncbi:MAG TPA: murein L,D-transpeptidase catalytic domain family protein [Puia sp.]|nr:murein L,D-transpeptidase catalytic domain family protein [Puia sp.]